MKYSTTVQTGPGARPAFCTMDTGSFPAVKWQGLGFNYPPKSKDEVKEKNRSVTLLSLWDFVACYIGPV